jgi:hypothetical protein
VISGFLLEVAKIYALLEHYAASSGTKVRKNPEERCPQRLNIFSPLRGRTLQTAHSGTFGCYGHLALSLPLTSSEFMGLRVVKMLMYTSHSHRGCGGITPFIRKLATGLELTGQPHAVLCFGKEPPSIIRSGVWVGGRPGLGFCEKRNGSCTCLESSCDWSVL